MSFLTSFSQNVVSDANNSSTANVNAGLTFVGTATSTLGVAGIQVSLKTDQNAIVYVEQSPGLGTGTGTVITDGTVSLSGSGTDFLTRTVGDQIYVSGETVRIIDAISSNTLLTVSSAFSTSGSGLSYQMHNWDVIDTYNYYYSINNFGVTVQAINSYVRTRVKNNSTSNTTYFRLQTVLCPIIEAVPRSLDGEGNFKTSIQSIEDLYGFEVENTPMGEMRVAQPVRLVGASYEGNTIDPAVITSAATGTGATITQSGRLIFTSGTANAATVYAYSVRKGRYIGGSSNRYRSQRRIDAGTANNNRRWGIGLAANYALTISSASVVAGDVYTNNNQQFTIMVSGTVTTAYVYGTGNPGAGAQTYTKITSSSTGPATLTGSTFAANYLLTDGAWFQYNGTTFGIRVMAGGSLVTGGNIDTGSFNGKYGALYTPGTGLTAYEIYYTNSKIIFVIDGIPLHTFSLTSGNWSNSRTLHVFADSINTGTATSVTMESYSETIYRLGLINTENSIRYINSATTTICKYGPGRLKRIIINYPSSAAQVITIYDALAALTGNLISLLTIEQDGNQNSMLPYNIEYDIPFHNGLTVVTSTTNPVTVIFE